MRKIVIAAAIVFASSSCGPTESPADNPNNQKALEMVKLEPKVKDATITDANVLYAAVKDDGTIRNGYAEYLCQVLTQNNSTVKWVKVVKYGSMNDPNADNAYGILLGEAFCK